MRLRILVKRHTLPDCRVVWPVNEDVTISQLLEQLNEIFPLESEGEWGLEDYAVELKGSRENNFECLHFLPVGDVLTDNDEVVIRPLLSSDVRQRRISGRRQVSSDGRHLFDGCSFGRPRPRDLVPRPTLSIPPRKRRRIMYHDEGNPGVSEADSDGSGNGNFQTSPHVSGNELVLHASFEDDDDEEDDEYDEDFEPESSQTSDSEEAQSVMDEDENLTSGAQNVGKTSQGSPHSSPKMPTKLRLKDLRSTFPSAPEAVCRQIWKSSEGDYDAAWQILARGFKPLRSVNATSTPRKPGDAEADGSEIPVLDAALKVGIGGEQRGVDNGLDPVEPGGPVDSTQLRYYDQHGLPRGSISTSSRAPQSRKLPSSGTGDQVKPSALHKGRKVSTGSNMSVTFADDTVQLSERNRHEGEGAGCAKSSIVFESDRSSESEAEASEDDEEDSDDSDGSSNETEESVDDTETSQAESSSQSDSDTSSSGTSSSEEDSDDSSPEADTRSEKPDTQPVASQPPERKTSEKPQSPEAPKTIAVPPGKGKPATRARNERRKKSAALRRLIESAMLPAGTTLSEFNQLDMPNISTREEAFEALAKIKNRDQGAEHNGITTSTLEAETEFELRRRQLLESLAGGGIEVDSRGHGKSHTITGDAKPVSVPLPKSSSSGKMPPAVSEAMVVETTPSASRDVDEQPNALEASNVASDDAADRPRMRLNMGAGRRLLFGALGLKAPKTKADEEKLKHELMKDVRPAKPNPRAVENTEEKEVSEDEDPDVWRDRITLRAVECCYDGVEYSEPPFPFRQRWDPQQWGGNSTGKRGATNKKKARNEAHFYEQESMTKKRRSGRSQLPVEDYNEDYSTYSDQGLERDLGPANGSSNPQGTNAGKSSSDAADAEIKEQLLAESQSSLAFMEEHEMDDLPVGPSDKTSLPMLLRQALVPGLVIVFKQLIMSEATQWQPQISNYRTAVILGVDGSGEVRARLAERDRVMTEKYYDEDTGERVYGKFEVPDDEDEMEDDGCISISFDELIEPRVVQAAPMGPTEDTFSGETGENNLMDKKNAAVTEHVTSEEAPEKASAVAHTHPHSTSLESGNIHDDMMTGMHDHSPSRDVEADLSDVSVAPFHVMSDDTRQELGNDVREADVRSSIPSSVLRAAQLNSAHEFGDTTRTFPSSPPLHDVQSIQSSPAFETLRSIPPSPKLSSSPHSLSDAQSKNDVTGVQTAEVQYPKLPLPVFLDGEDTEYDRQPDFSPPGQGTLDDFVETELDNGDPEDDSARDEMHRGMPSVDKSVSSGDTPCMPLSQPPADHASSDINLPELDDVFELYSTARSSVLVKPERTSPVAQPQSEAEKRDQESYEAAMARLDEEELDSHDIKEEDTPVASRRNEQSTNAPKVKCGSRRTKTAARKAFEVPPGSQQVDLTRDSEISPPPTRRSRTVVGSQSWSDDGSWHEGSGLPTGPGGVQKRKRATKSVGPSSASQIQEQRTGKETLKQRLNRRKSATGL